MTDNTSQKEYLKVENESRQPSLEDFYKWFESNREELLAAAQYNQEINSKLREEFIEEWPLERLQTMTIDEYVIGKRSQNQSLCYLIEQGKYKHLYIGIGGGAASKFGIYWSKKKNAYVDHRNQVISEEQIKEKFTNLKNDLYEIISAGISFDFDNSVFDTRNTRNSFFTRSAMIIKLLCIYSGGEPFFGVNINSYQKEFWSKLLPLPTQGGVYRQNHELVEIIQNKYPELNGSILGGTLHQYFREYIEEKKLMA
ncbi:hypothetical protein K6V78_04845 [Streptococcus gallolyticus]|nr:hypothetical protein [Streptococcus gallolyticus]MBY5040961.1 hypothetical protein [Streptococcus gallolyticus]